MHCRSTFRSGVKDDSETRSCQLKKLNADPPCFPHNVRRDVMQDLPATLITGESIALDAASVNALKAALGGDVIIFGDSDDQSARQGWNGMIDRHPALI